MGIKKRKKRGREKVRELAVETKMERNREGTIERRDRSKQFNPDFEDRKQR